MSDESGVQTKLEIHKAIAETLRHSATIIWQFSVAILTLQAGALAFAYKDGMIIPECKAMVATAFFLSACFAFMLLRQSLERHEMAKRIRAVETDLRVSFPLYFAEIHESRFTKWFKSYILGSLVFIESVAATYHFVRVWWR